MTNQDGVQSQNLRKTATGWLYFFLKLGFFVSAFVLIMLTVMANMGGNSDNLRQAVEQFIGENMGYTARIEKLNRLSFFPRIAVDFENLALYPPLSPAADPQITAERAVFSFDFWDVFFSTGKMQRISLRDVKAMPGAWSAQALEIRSLDIVDQTESAALLKAEGHIGKSPYTLSLDLEAAGAKGARKYAFGPVRGFKATLEGFVFTGRIVDSARGLAVEDLRIADGHDIASGTLSLERLEDHAVGLTGVITLARGAAVFKPDVKIAFAPAPFVDGGRIVAENLALEDLAPGAPLQKIMTRLGDIFAWNKSPREVDIRFIAEPVTRGGAADGIYDGKLPLKAGAIDAAAIEKRLKEKP